MFPYRRQWLSKRVLQSLVILAGVNLLSGCIATGIRVGPVFIPVDTGIGKDKQPPTTEDSTESQTEQESEQTAETKAQQPDDLFQCEAVDDAQSKGEQTAQCKPKNKQDKKYPFEEGNAEIHF